MAIKLKAKIRTVVGKGAARSIRKNKNIPAVIYGEKTQPTPIEIDGRAFETLIKTPALKTKLFEIETEKGKETAMLVDIQYHPITDKVIHADFKRIDVEKPIRVVVPVEVVNKESSKGIKLGGVLSFTIRKVALIGLIQNIPEKITIDLSDLTIGDSVHGRDLVLPKGVELGLHQADLAFASIGGKMAEEEEAKPAPSAAAAATTEAAAGAPTQEKTEASESEKKEPEKK